MDDATLVAVLKNRLAVDETPLRRLIGAVDSLRSAVTAEVSPGEIAPSKSHQEHALQVLRLRMAEARLAMSRRARQRQVAIQLELGLYNDKIAAVDHELRQAKDELDQLATELEAAKRRRAQLSEYDDLARDCLKFPSREDSLKQVVLIQSEIVELERAVKLHECKLNRRRHEYLKVAKSQRAYQRWIEAVHAGTADDDMPLEGIESPKEDAAMMDVDEIEGGSGSVVRRLESSSRRASLRTNGAAGLTTELSIEEDDDEAAVVEEVASDHDETETQPELGGKVGESDEEIGAGGTED